MYRGEIAARQLAHFPRSASHEMIGMFCHHLIGALHFGQCDGGEITDSPLGARQITTLRNEAMHAPIQKLKKTSIGKSSFKMSADSFMTHIIAYSAEGIAAPKTRRLKKLLIACHLDKIIPGAKHLEERELDLHRVVNISNYFAEADVSGSTNGWYAVNKGRVSFPRTWFNKSSAATRCSGDTSYQDKPRFVNSVKFSITGSGDGNESVFRCALYAPDRSDIPAGLPQDATVIGVWNMGLFTGTDSTSKRSFDSVSLTFRYDHTKVPDGGTVKLYRYNGTVWTKVGTATESRSGEHLISTGALSKLTTGSNNIGFFAALVPKPGLMILVR